MSGKIEESGLPVDGIDVEVGWIGYDPEEWRDHDEPAGMDEDNDEDAETPADVVSLLGFDPDEEGWE